ncbi:DUF1850 domain-containing protein [Thermococcus paralvinellae]|uniref:DUF1850 domain-containing protein n=1 Tax=Thermococcus paralvinellae TaxID=582419 RepID=W0I0U7_9EURY|nr:DUF1850 domain-containing protein [Thermococcus paralvinellae]AHF79671.1 Hypothetical protein TES1_0276 [Thermococcus paralvinellae]
MKKSFLFFLLLFILLFPVSVIGIEFNGNVCYYPLSSNSTLEISYTHSVSLTRVIDTYRISKDGIYALQERWQEFLAGQPIDFDYRAGSFYVKNLNTFLGKSWEYWFIPVNNVTVKIDEKIVFVQPKEEGIMKIEVKKVPIFLIISRRC